MKPVVRSIATCLDFETSGRTGLASRFVSGERSRPGYFGAGQEDSETGDAFSRQTIASEPNSTVILLHDSLANPQPQAGSFRRFGAEKRLKNSPRILRPDTRSGVDDGNLNSAPLPGPICRHTHAHTENATVWHGLDGIADQVEEHLPKLDRKPLHEARRKRGLVKLDSIALQSVLLQCEHALEQFRDGN